MNINRLSNECAVKLRDIYSEAKSVLKNKDGGGRVIKALTADLKFFPPVGTNKSDSTTKRWDLFNQLKPILEVADTSGNARSKLGIGEANGQEYRDTAKFPLLGENCGTVAAAKLVADALKAAEPLPGSIDRAVAIRQLDNFEKCADDHSSVAGVYFVRLGKNDNNKLEYAGGWNPLFRSSEQKEVNNAVGKRLRDVVSAYYGGAENVPETVKDALGTIGTKGVPLTAKRIKNVCNAIRANELKEEGVKLPLGVRPFLNAVCEKYGLESEEQRKPIREAILRNMVEKPTGKKKGSKKIVPFSKVNEADMLKVLKDTALIKKLVSTGRTIRIKSSGKDVFTLSERIQKEILDNRQVTLIGNLGLPVCGELNFPGAGNLPPEQRDSKAGADKITYTYGNGLDDTGSLPQPITAALQTLPATLWMFTDAWNNGQVGVKIPKPAEGGTSVKLSYDKTGKRLEFESSAPYMIDGKTRGQVVIVGQIDSSGVLKPQEVKFVPNA